MSRSIAALLAASLLATGCGTLFNAKTIEVNLPSGASTDSGSTTLSQSEDHVVTYENGSKCTIESGVSISYVLLDLFLTGPIGLIIDGVTGNWKVLEGGCPGVSKA